MDGRRRTDTHNQYMKSMDRPTGVRSRRNPLQKRTPSASTHYDPIHRETPTSMNGGLQRNPSRGSDQAPSIPPTSINESACCKAGSKSAPKSKSNDGVGLSKISTHGKAKMKLEDDHKPASSKRFLTDSQKLMDITSPKTGGSTRISPKVGIQTAKTDAAKQSHRKSSTLSKLSRVSMLASSGKEQKKHLAHGPGSNRRIDVSNQDVRKNALDPDLGEVYGSQLPQSLEGMTKPGGKLMYLTERQEIDGEEAGLVLTAIRLEPKQDVTKQLISGEAMKSISIHMKKDTAECVAEAVNARVKAADMPSIMQVHAFCCARRAYDSLVHDRMSLKNLTFALKQEFDKAYGSGWNCVVGTNFGSFVTRSVGGFLYFSIEELSILLFKFYGAGVTVIDS
eukprot:Gb_19477 [translate_table: standard]